MNSNEERRRGRIEVEREAAEERVTMALAHLSEAQRLVDRAAQQLCSVNGLAPEWQRLCLLLNGVKRHWRAISRKTDRLVAQDRLFIDPNLLPRIRE